MLFLPSLIAFVPLSQDPAPADPKADGAPLAPPPALVVGQPAPELAVDRWHEAEAKDGKVTRSSSTSGGMVDQDALQKRMEALKGNPTLAALHGAVIVVHRTPSSDKARWSDLIELVEANRDGGAMMVALVAADDAEPTAERLKNEQLPGPIGIVAPGTTSIWARDEIAVIGKSGELVALSAKLDEVRKAFAEALERPEGLAIERPLDLALAGALGDYWAGRYDKARTAARSAEKKAQSDASGKSAQLAEDAAHLAGRVDAVEKEFVAKAATALSGGNVEQLVDVDLVLSRGFKGAVAKTASESLSKVMAQTLMEGRIRDYRRFLELVEDRPILFPRADDAAGKALVKALESFLKQSANDALAQQRARGLIQRYRARHGGR